MFTSTSFFKKKGGINKPPKSRKPKSSTYPLASLTPQPILKYMSAYARNDNKNHNNVITYKTIIKDGSIEVNVHLFVDYSDDFIDLIIHNMLKMVDFEKYIFNGSDVSSEYKFLSMVLKRVYKNNVGELKIGKYVFKKNNNNLSLFINYKPSVEIKGEKTELKEIENKINNLKKIIEGLGKELIPLTKSISNLEFLISKLRMEE